MADVSLTGSLLVASPTMLDPHFVGAVVLIIDHDDQGAVGVVLNRPTEVPIADHLPDWADLVDAPGTVFAGGPVQPAVAIAVGSTTEPPIGWVALSGDLGLVDLDTAVGPVERLRVFAGYAGWGAGQLEDEIDSGDWIVVAAEPDDPFTIDPDGLWRRVLGRQDGPARLLALYPDDPTLN